MSKKTFTLGNYEYRSDIMEDIEQRLQYMIDRYCRAYVVRLDVSFPDGYLAVGANEECSDLMKRLKEYYTYHGVVTHYVGVREQNTSKNPHYHIAIVFDGSKIDNGWAVLIRAAAIWPRIVGFGADACVHLCRTFDGANGIKIERPRTKSVGLDLQNELAAFHASVHAAMTWLSYLAKSATKGSAPPKTKEFFCSRL
jgi:Inovirus Gp2